MTTIQPLGNHGMAGSKDYPTSYKIKACPKCYAVLYWRRSSTHVTCDNCETEIVMLPFKGPLDYVKYHVRKKLLSRTTFLLVAYGLIQIMDYKLKLRKLLLFAFIRGLSYT